MSGRKLNSDVEGSKRRNGDLHTRGEGKGGVQYMGRSWGVPDADHTRKRSCHSFLGEEGRQLDGKTSKVLLQRPCRSGKEM